MRVIWNYQRHPTYEEAQALYAPILDYSVPAMDIVAQAAGTNDPDKFLYFMGKAAQIDPSRYLDIADYYRKIHNYDLAATNYELGLSLNPDAVENASRCGWLMRYYLQKMRTADAHRVADFAGDVYSSAGLQTKAEFFEATGDYDNAFGWYVKNEERYDDSLPLINFCLRFKDKTGSTNYDAQLQERVGKIFPKGMEPVTLKDFGFPSTPPRNGVFFKGENKLLTDAGMKWGTVVVAINGTRIHNFVQYRYVRDSGNFTNLDLIVWQGGRYREFTPNPPNHLFGVEMGDYPPKAERR